MIDGDKRCGCGNGCDTFGHCLRRKRLQIDRHGLQHSAAEKFKNWELDKYEEARRGGLQPEGTRWHQTRKAMSDADRS